MSLSFGKHSITALSTPGRTTGCLTFVTSDRLMAFIGDCLPIRGAGRTDFQSGDDQTLWGSIVDKMFSLPEDCLLYPGHNYMDRTVSTVAEEQEFNPRIGGEASQEDFAGSMNNLGLPHPRQLDIALSANLKSGKPDIATLKQTWTPINITFSGTPEVEPYWVARNRDKICTLDVRGESEYSNAPSCIHSSMLVPLDQLRTRINIVPTDKPIVAIRQSDKRSSVAVKILENAGIDEIANFPVGIINWSRLALPGLISTL